MTITPLFAAPFMKINLLADYDLEALATYANIQMAKDSDGIVKSNVGGWHSKNLDLRDATITRTLRKLGQHINQFIDFYKVDREKYNWEFTESWFNTNNKGDFNVSHVHPNSFLSGVFYLKTYEDAGDLVFHHHARNIDYHKQPIAFNQDGPGWACKNALHNANYSYCFNSGTVFWINNPISQKILRLWWTSASSSYIKSRVVSNN